MSDDVRVYQLWDGSTELHMVGEYTCVRWNCQHERRRIKGYDDGREHLSEVMIRSGQPFIDIVMLRENERNGVFYLDGDRPTRGGMSVNFARQIARELVLAADYLEKVLQQEKTK